VLDDALAVALAEPEDEEEELAVDPLCALPSELERLAVRAPSAPDRALAETALLLAHEVGLFLVREDEKVISAHYNELAMIVFSLKTQNLPRIDHHQCHRQSPLVT
jgi:predicted NodU family carbamoyl transferase